MASADEAKIHPRLRALRVLARGSLILLMGLALLEVGLHMAARFAPDRTSVWRPQSSRRILCVGDSHTWGSGVSRDESYPAHLQRWLDELEPGVYSVVNQGLPGMNSAQIRERLPVWIQRYRPHIVVLWVGVNDAWNRAQMRDRTLARAWLDGLLSHVRLYTFLRVWLHDRELARYVPESREELIWHERGREGNFGARPRFEMRHDGVVEKICHERDDDVSDREGVDRIARRVERNLSFVVEYAEAAGFRLVFVTYPLPASWYLAANRGIRSVAARHEVPVVDSAAAVNRVPLDEHDWSGDAHPGPRLYREIAREMAAVVSTSAERSGVGAGER